MALAQTARAFAFRNLTLLASNYSNVPVSPLPVFLSFRHAGWLYRIVASSSSIPWKTSTKSRIHKGKCTLGLVCNSCICLAMK